MIDDVYFWGTGRRKRAIARVRLKPGSGAIVVNGKPFEHYFALERLRKIIKTPLAVSDAQERFDVFVNVCGGGPSGQAGATVMGLSRALVSADAAAEPELRRLGFLTRDPRMVERKKYGYHKARRGHQFSKR